MKAFYHLLNIFLVRNVYFLEILIILDNNWVINLIWIQMKVSKLKCSLSLFFAATWASIIMDIILDVSEIILVNWNHRYLVFKDLYDWVLFQPMVSKFMMSKCKFSITICWFCVCIYFMFEISKLSNVKYVLLVILFSWF